ncbi:dynein beta chain, ciliary-like [Petromyzon marinus]|uniref:dynein beta chain, ciliary-like n=1 Tax=Petromyzon marinus TaxID=7757 RepID=UPI003F7203B5
MTLDRFVPCGLQLPAQVKGKALCVLRRQRGPPTVPPAVPPAVPPTVPTPAEWCRASLTFCELSPSVLQQLATLIEEVVVPVLSNEQNHASWPAAVAQDVERHVEGMRGHALAARGQAQGRTLLPLPGLAERSRSARSPSVREMPDKPEPYDRLVVHAVESTVVEWSRQIRAVLASDSAQALRAGAHPGPRAELEFWSARAENLQCIDEQLNTPRVRELSRVLERAESSYCPAFQQICQEVATGKCVD